MTLSVGVTLRDGIVLASDSRATLRRGDHWRIATDYADKLIQLGDRFVCSIAGAWWLGSKTTTTALHDIAEAVAAVETTTEAATMIRDMLYESILADPEDPENEERRKRAVSFYLAGYDPDGVGRIHAVQALTGEPMISWTRETTSPFVSLHWRCNRGLPNPLGC